MRLKYLLLICVLFGNLGLANNKDNGGDACERRFKEIRDDIDS